MAVYQIYPGKKKSLLKNSNPFKMISDLWENLNVTKKLITINIFSFIVFWILISFKIIPLDYVALNPNAILSKFYFWTFLTSMFMHAGIFHIFVNMLSLYFVGSFIENILGKKRYFWVYMIAGLFSGLLFVISAFLFPSNMGASAVGASGAIFGLVGLLMMLTPNLRVYIMFIPIPIKMKYAAPGMLILLWIVSAVGNIPIGNIAHLGGLIVGLVYGLILIKRFPNKIKHIRERFN